jgi:hypothetical protein
LNRFFSYKRFSSTVALLLVVAISWSLLNKALFVHTHVTPAGKMVVHAHPYNKKADNQPVKNHYHACHEWIIFQQLDATGLLALISLLLFLPVITLASIPSSRVFSSRDLLLSYPGRAPPAW